MIDLSKLADYPLWVKLLALVWLLITILLAIIILFKKPEQPAQPPSSISQPVPKPAVIPKEQIDILILLSKQGELFTFQIAQILNISEDIAKYHLQKLRTNKLVIELTLPYRGLPGQHSWFINDKGKAYLIENKLLS